MTDASDTPLPRHTGGKFRKGVSGNPGGKKRVIAPQAPQPEPQKASNPQEQPEVEQPSNSGRNADGTFAKGNNANPAGKPKGTRHAATKLAEALIDGQAEALVQRALALAMGGDPTAMRIVMDRLCPPRRERTVTVDLPSIKSGTDLIAAAAALTQATAAGDITPSEAASLSTLVGNVAKAVETVEIVARLAKLEEQLAVKGSA
jgi:Family of unknown function (DUF5681)